MTTQHEGVRAARGARLGAGELARQAIRMTMRDWRAGELTLLVLALVLAVAALTSVGFLSDRLRQGLERDARQMLGADFVVRGDRPVDPSFAAAARADGLATASTAIFPSMVGGTGAGAPSRLAAVKAVSAGYPLRGRVEIAASAGAPGRPAGAIPAPGTVWADPALLDALHLKVGDAVRVGRRHFTIAAAITRELDRGFSFVNFSPRLMLREDELASTGLVGYGSRVTYRLLVAGPDAAVARFAAFAHQRVDGGKLRGVALESLQEGQPQVRETLDRARHFLTLVSLLTALLSAVAIAMAAQRYMRRHLDGCAAMRCLGASQRTLAGLFTLEFVAIGVASGLLGAALGYLGHLVLLAVLGSLIDVVLPQPGIAPALVGVGAGLVLLLGFALPPLMPLTRVPPVRVLRREWGGEGRAAWLGYGLGVVLFAALLIAAAGNLMLGLIVAGGFAGGLVLFATLARVLLFAAARAVRDARVGAGLGWRYAIASLHRRGAASALQITALALGLMCLLLISITRDDLVAGWRKSTPPDAPNQFLIDIQPDQRPEVVRYLASQGIDDAPLEPMVRGRLIAIDGRPVNPGSYADANTRRLVDREFNLSYTTQLPDDNRIVAGRWFGVSSQPQVSIEAGLAKALGVKLGDTLRFDVTGLTVEAPVTSIRKLDWGTFRVNFFVLMPPAALEDMPAMYITSFHLPPRRSRVIDGLIARQPGITAIDVAPILAQVQRVLLQVVGAVQLLFGFTLAAGILVLYTALAGSRDEREREAALLRALGASRAQIGAVQRAEFVIVGTIAGVCAALGALAIGSVLAVQVFRFELALNPWLVPAGIAAGIVCAGAAGWWSLRRVLARPALRSLRDA
ncbi:ABC transporter permease [Burkholderia glumae]|uniref:ABC transporter permease n=3 Tax=Burkholderia glumae TaxID=337 RepID=UPI00148E9FCB|nr:FtsX-like permease family protein [Burkholderia glumae]MCQ0029575.1 FtsX-like permease family protein [Burkholderia glumae]MCQ0035046.1 FtsX-like permease family protein [Burkholderia glumae]MCR1768557.1 FtsX-like permease family protein [Burkholderia glumae]QJW79832.1 FtsX-like permease family protein [Burkholderia glumae]